MSNIKSLTYSLESNPSHYSLVEELSHVSKEAKDLISAILKRDTERLSIAEIMSHQWLT